MITKGLLYSIPKYSAFMPWWMLDIDNYQLITSTSVPEEIKDDKSVVLAEVVIPGMNYAPLRHASNGNNIVSFTLKIVRRNNTVGNVFLLKQMEQLRNQRGSFVSIYKQQFAPNPRVLYCWGTGKVPLIYYVQKCAFTHKSNMTNNLGNPQHTDVEFELKLDESNPLYTMEELFRRMSALNGSILEAFDTALNVVTGAKTV